MSLPSRIVPDLVPGNVVKSQELDDEFNRIYNFLAGQNLGFSVRIVNSDNGFACARFDQTGANHILELYGNGAEVIRVEKDGDIVSPFLSSAGGIYTFTQIPIGPASNPTTDNQLARKLYVDGKQTRWAATFFIGDIAAQGVDLNFANIQGAWIPGSNFTATHIGAKFNFGSASGSFTITFRKQPFGSQTQTDLGTITFNSGTVGVGIETDITDHLFTANDFVYPVITAVSSSLHKAVWMSIRGFQTPQ